MLDDVRLPSWLARGRRFPLDGALLVFDRDTGWNALCEGSAVAHLRARAPRSVQFSITNRCNLACAFCSRDPASATSWSPESAFAMLAGLSAAGVLEVAFGGGEPTIFPGFFELVQRLYRETELAVSFTTNGTGLTEENLARIQGSYGQLRLSLYDDNDWRAQVSRLAQARARFGVNLLVTPKRLHALDTTVLELATLGATDVLLLSYNGTDDTLHLSAAEASDLAGRVQRLARALSGRASLKLSVCWGERLEAVPRAFAKTDCGAGREFVVLTADRRLAPCSFHHFSIPVKTAADVMAAWRGRRAELAKHAGVRGCARPGPEAPP